MRLRCARMAFGSRKADRQGRALDHWLQAEMQLVLSSVWRNDFQGDALEKTRPIVRTRPFSVLPRPEPISAQLTSIVPLANDSKT